MSDAHETMELDAGGRGKGIDCLRVNDQRDTAATSPLPCNILGFGLRHPVLSFTDTIDQ